MVETPRRESRSSRFHSNDDTFRIQSGYRDHPKAIPSRNHPLAYKLSLETRRPVGVCGAAVSLQQAVLFLVSELFLTNYSVEVATKLTSRPEIGLGG